MTGHLASCATRYNDSYDCTCVPSTPKSDSGAYASYYELPPNCTKLQDLLYGMTFKQGNIFKAAYRWDKNPDLVYNLEKMIFYAQDELNRIYASDPENPRHEQK